MPYEDIGTYKVDLKAFIKHGGYGDVFQAKCTDTHNLHDKVAVKSIPLNSIMCDQGVVKALETLAAFSNPHPHIVSLLHHEEKEGRLWLVMDYCDQGDINEYLSNQKADLRLRVAFVRQAVSALHHMHTLRPRPIVHRAIKTSNVLVSSTSSGPVVKLVDFGLEKILSRKVFDRQGFSSLHGMCLFMAPELFAGLSTDNIEYEKSLDMFALGILILALLQCKPLQGLQPMTEGGQPLGMVMFHNYIQQLPNWSPVVFNPDDSIYVTHLKALVACMVRFNPENRVTIEQVKKQIDDMGEIQQHDVNQDAKVKENMDMAWGGTQIFTQQFKQFITPPVNITMGTEPLHMSNGYQANGDTVSFSANKDNVMGEEALKTTNHTYGRISDIDNETDNELAIPKTNKTTFNGEHCTNAPDGDSNESKDIDVTYVNGTPEYTKDSSIDRNIDSSEPDAEPKDANEHQKMQNEHQETGNESLIVGNQIQGPENKLELESNNSKTTQTESNSEIKDGELAIPRTKKVTFDDGEHCTDGPDGDSNESKYIDVTCDNGTPKYTKDSCIDRNIAESSEPDAESKDANEYQKMQNEHQENDVIHNQSLIVGDLIKGLEKELEYEPNNSATTQFESKSEIRDGELAIPRTKKNGNDDDTNEYECIDVTCVNETPKYTKDSSIDKNIAESSEPDEESKDANEHQKMQIEHQENDVIDNQSLIVGDQIKGLEKESEYEPNNSATIQFESKSEIRDGELAIPRTKKDGNDDDTNESECIDVTCVNETPEYTKDSCIDKNIAKSSEPDEDSKDPNEHHENDENGNESLIVGDQIQGPGNEMSKSEIDLMHQCPSLSKEGGMPLACSGIAAFGWKNEVLVDGVRVFTKYVYQAPKYHPLFNIERLDECPFYITENGYTLLQDDKSFPHTTKVYNTEGAIVYAYQGNYGNLLGGYHDKLVYVCPQQGILSFYKVSNHQNVGEVVLPADVSISSMALCSDPETGFIVIVGECRLHIMDEDGGNMIATSLSYRVNECADPTSNGKNIFLVDINERLIHVHDWNGHEVWCIDDEELGLGSDEVIVSIGCTRGSILHVSVEEKPDSVRMIAFKLYM